MSDDLDTRIRALRGRVTTAQYERVRANHQRDAAQAAADDARAKLARDFGVTTAEQARAKLAELEQQLDTALAALDRDLAELGA